MSNTDKHVSVGNIKAMIADGSWLQLIRKRMGLGDTLGPLEIEHGGTGCSDLTGLSALVNESVELASGLSLAKSLTINRFTATTAPSANSTYGSHVFLYVRADGSYVSISTDSYTSSTRNIKVSGTTKGGVSISTSTTCSMSSIYNGSFTFTPFAYAMQDDSSGNFYAYIAGSAYNNGYHGQGIITVKATSNGALSASAASVSTDWSIFQSGNQVNGSRNPSSSYVCQLAIDWCSFRRDDGCWVGMKLNSDSSQCNRLILTSNGAATIDSAETLSPALSDPYRYSGMAFNTGSRVISHCTASDNSIISIGMEQGSSCFSATGPTSRLRPVLDSEGKLVLTGSGTAANGSSVFFTEYTIGESSVSTRNTTGLSSSTALSVTPTSDNCVFFDYGGVLYGVNHTGKTLAFNCDTGTVGQDALITQTDYSLTEGHSVYCKPHDGGGGWLHIYLGTASCANSVTITKFLLEE